MTKPINQKSQSDTSDQRLQIGRALTKIGMSIALSIVFFLVVTPIGLLMRITGRDPMGVADKSDQQSCRIVSKERKAKHVKTAY